MPTPCGPSSRWHGSNTSAGPPRRSSKIPRRSAARSPGSSRRSGFRSSNGSDAPSVSRRPGNGSSGGPGACSATCARRSPTRRGRSRRRPAGFRVGFRHTVGARWLPERLAAFLRAHPGVRFILEEGTTAEVASGVLAGDFDVGILGPPPLNTPDLETVPLFRERVAVVVPLEHRLAGRTSVRLTDIADEPLILPRSRSGLRRVIDDAFASQGLAPRVAYEGDDFSIVQGLVEAGLGITLMPMPLPAPSARVTVIPLRDPP